MILKYNKYVMMKMFVNDDDDDDDGDPNDNDDSKDDE